MTIGLVGRKSGMTRVFTAEGVSIPVTVVEITPNRVTQIKEIDSDGYRAIQVTRGSRKASRVSKSQAGQFAKAGVEAGTGLWEFRLGSTDEAPAVGSELTVERFTVGQKVDVAGKSKGKGFQGVMKRHNYSGGPASHGSTSYREVGSIGASSFPSRVWKNKGMPGHMGSERVSIKNLRVIEVKAEQNLLLISGAVPGAKGTYLEIRKEG